MSKTKATSAYRALFEVPASEAHKVRKGDNGFSDRMLNQRTRVLHGEAMNCKHKWQASSLDGGETRCVHCNTPRPTVRKGQAAKPTQPHRDRSKYQRVSDSRVTRAEARRLYGDKED